MKRSPTSANTKRASKQKKSQARSLHTPGPWSVDHVEPSAAEGAAYALTLVVETEETHIAFCFNDSPGNAALIAAAPDLLKAAQLQILNFQRQDASDNFLGDDDHEAWTALGNAVKKATSVPAGGNG